MKDPATTKRARTRQAKAESKVTRNDAVQSQGILEQQARAWGSGGTIEQGDYAKAWAPPAQFSQTRPQALHAAQEEASARRIHAYKNTSERQRGTTPPRPRRLDWNASRCELKPMSM